MAQLASESTEPIKPIHATAHNADAVGLGTKDNFLGRGEVTPRKYAAGLSWTVALAMK